MPTTPKKKADAKFSAGARYERKAVRAYLRSYMTRSGRLENKELNNVLLWVLSREKRYSKRPGGLGK